MFRSCTRSLCSPHPTRAGPKDNARHPKWGGGGRCVVRLAEAGGGGDVAVELLAAGLARLPKLKRVRDAGACTSIYTEVVGLSATVWLILLVVSGRRGVRQPHTPCNARIIDVESSRLLQLSCRYEF